MREDPVVDELAEWPDRRVFVRDAGQQQFLETMRRRLRVGTLARELVPEAIQQAGRIRPEALLQVREGRGDRARPTVRLVPCDQEVADLVQESQRSDLSGLELVRRAIEQVAAARPVEDADA